MYLWLPMNSTALEELYALGAIDEAGDLTTPLGDRMADAGLDPMMAKMVSILKKQRQIILDKRCDS